MLASLSIFTLLVLLANAAPSLPNAGPTELAEGLPDEQAKIYAAEAVIDDDLRDHKVMLYSKTYCRHSKIIKRILDKYKFTDIETRELDLEDRPVMNRMQDYIKSISGIRTVPQLFIDGQFIGGHTEAEELHKTGELRELFARARALVI